MYRTVNIDCELYVIDDEEKIRRTTYNIIKIKKYHTIIYSTGTGTGTNVYSTRRNIYRKLIIY